MLFQWPLAKLYLSLAISFFGLKSSCSLTAISLDSTGYFLSAVDLTQDTYHVLRDIEQSINAVPQCINGHNEQHGIEINHLNCQIP